MYHPSTQKQSMSYVQHLCVQSHKYLLKNVLNARLSSGMVVNKENSLLQKNLQSDGEKQT